MSGWEVFTWFNAGVLAAGSVVVFAFFMAQLPRLLRPPDRREPGASEREPDPQESSTSPQA